MGKHRGNDENIDPNDTQGLQIRNEIPLDESDARLAEDVKIVDQGWNQRYDSKGNPK